ncbi:uncharacterized protein LOC143546294 [Bidens hawaiensis]|uniref:uncharacterized protein LOC143546294 n=1 Tax=Bidens hawaiensis TaxID=980011 RepID=UPI00404979C5
MAAMKGKNKMIDVAECSNKRRRTQTLNIEPPSTDLQFSPPSPFSPSHDYSIPLLQPFHDHQQQQQETEVDQLMNCLMPQQNLIIDYHLTMMQRNVEEFWKRNLADEINKRKEIEARLNEREEQADRFRQMYFHYEKRAFELEQTMEQQVALAQRNAMRVVTPEEEVQSCLVDLNSVQRPEVTCKNCHTRPATMLWLPCRHLCVCLVCERRVKICPICGVRKTESIKIDLP